MSTFTLSLHYLRNHFFYFCVYLSGDNMKKIVLLYLCLIFVCGCGNKLTCTHNDSYDDIKIKNKIEFDFKSETYKQIDKMIFSDNVTASEYFDDIKEYVDEYNLKLENNTIISVIEDKIKLNATKKEIKKQYEDYDYICK